MLDYINKYDIFIFDINNAIVDVEEYHYKAWLETLQNILGKEFTFSFQYFSDKFHPKDPESIVNYLSKILKLDNYDEIMLDKNRRYINILNQNNIKLIDGVYEFIQLIITNDKKFIIISDTFKNNIEIFINLFPFLKKASNYYYRELFDSKKLDKNDYINIINNYSNYKIAYFTYYIIVIDALYYKDVDLIYINNNESDYHNNLIIKDYHNIKYVRDYYQLDILYIENKIVNTLRVLSIDMINEANSGHPGMALGCAPTMYVLWCKIMNYNPLEPLLYNRDKFILSNGHGCALLYSILYLLGYNYKLEDLKKFRQINSITHGHPEYNPKLGIEITTGPLGQGIANGVGMAIASKKLNLDNKIYVMCGDGCLMEGISYEACSLAGHLELNNLILLYDNNNITIDGSIKLTFTENIKKRFKSQNWDVLEVLDGDSNLNDIYEKLLLSKKSDKPTIILIKTTIGYGTLKSGTSASHGIPLGEKNTIELKKKLDFDIYKTFHIDNDVKLYFKNLIENKKKILKKRKLEDTTINYSNLFDELEILNNNIKDYATRDISNFCLNIIINNLDNIIVGSADLTESTKTIVKTTHITRNNFIGKYIHYGIREHAMVAIANGLSTYNFIPIVSTFLVFITYCLSGIRMAALSKHKVIYVLTHDSVFIGEDGATHQPIESLTILRSIPNLLTFRPCNIHETIIAYKIGLTYNGPTAIILTRQKIPYIDYKDNIIKGGYIIYDTENINLIIISTGSEVSLSIDIAKKLKNIRVISMLSIEIFEQQNIEYKNYILPKNIKKLVIEAGITNIWYKYADYVYGIDSFGISGNINDIKKYFKFTKDDICKYIIHNLY